MEEMYQDFIIELYRNPANFGRIDKPDLKGEANNTSCGDMVELFISVKGGVVSEAKFIGKGCAISQASSELLAGYLKGKKASELGNIGKKDALALLKIDLSRNPTRMKCALLPLDALRAALKAKRP